MSARDSTPPPSPDALPDRTIARVVVGALVVMVASILAASLLLRADHRPDAAVTPSSPGPAADPLERSLVERTRGGLDLRARQRAALESYGWVDRDAGVARIPIDRAIDLTVERAP